ncbi:regulator of G-protein signaling 9-binding protein isoform X1 [Hippocampus zosterae]|uniref:regulator of G-protein signaling 9-binding protein isoform X1 n=1 Tax=Hippocampus zosterae TaxID=109293 RepID=UPI00223CADEB|nr:regulator of G-protein signaling 9-binding protein isoform X1 [Hippocampus zosterae]
MTRLVRGNGASCAVKGGQPGQNFVRCSWQVILMPLVSNKVGDDCTLGTNTASVDGKAMVDTLNKVVACYRHLASFVGGCTDGLKLRDELRQTRERARELATTICQHLTLHLRDKSLPVEQRKEMELLWVALSSSLELLHVDMCKVYNMGAVFTLESPRLVQTGMQGGSSEIAARALSLPDLNRAVNSNLIDGFESQEHKTMEQEINQIDHMIEDMETKVNVLRWMVEPNGPLNAEPLGSADSASLALLSVDDEQLAGRQPAGRRVLIVALLLLCVVISVATTLSICIFFF